MAWDQGNEEFDIESPLPARFFNIMFVDGSFDRISAKVADEIFEVWAQKTTHVVEFYNLHGGKCIVAIDKIVGLVESDEEIREADRNATRWFRWEAHQDKYLDAFSDKMKRDTNE